MAIIDPEVLKKTQEGTVVIQVRDANGNALGWKGRFLPHVYDNFTECLRANAKANEEAECKKLNLNEHGQTQKQQKEFADRKKLQLARKEKADLALMGAAAEMRR